MNKKWLMIGGAGIVVAALAIWFVFLRNDAPDAVDVDAANEQLDADLAAAGDDGDDSADASTFDGDINGEWIIDDEIGDFDFETASGSFAGFRVDEELTVGAVVAVGRSGGVTGSLTIDDGQLIAADVTVDAVGTLTVNGVSNPTTFSITALVRDDGFGIVTGTTDIVFADFNVTPPSAPVVVSVDDHGIVEFQLVIAKG